MPVDYNLPLPVKAWDQQEVDRYSKLPFYLALQSAKFFPEWLTWNKLLGSIPWQPNMGTTMKGVILEPSPIGRVFFNPNPITQQPKKDIISPFERTNEALVYRHHFQSPQITFLPSFQDFRRRQIVPAQKDIVRQMAVADDQFARKFVFHGSPYVFISGKAGGEVTAAPIGIGNDAGTDGKTTAFLQDAVSQVGNNKGNLSLKVINKVMNVMKQDINAPFFEGMFNTPKPNESIKGKYCMVGSDEAFSMLTFDDHVLTYKDLNLNVLNEEFSGQLFGRVMYKVENFPIRIKADGTCPFPQLYEAGLDAFNRYETIPNPEYVSAPFEVAFILGGGSWDKVSIGPPPSEFASGKIAESKFNKLQWNAETRITDNVLVQIGVDGGGAPILDTNKYGDVLEIIGDAVFAQIAVNRRFCMPIIYRRWRIETN